MSPCQPSSPAAWYCVFVCVRSTMCAGCAFSVFKPDAQVSSSVVQTPLASSTQPTLCSSRGLPPTRLTLHACSGVLMVLIVVYTTHISRKAISNALLTSSDEQTVEMAADPDVAELLR